MGRYRSRSPSPRRSKRYDEPRSRRERSSPPPCGLLVRNISLDASPEDLRVRFEKFGPIKDIYLPKNYYTGEPRGFGFVKFRHPEDAAKAKDHLNYTVMGGREIRIVYAEESRRTPREMYGVSRTSDRGSYRRRSPVRSARRRYQSPSRSPSPARSDLRGRRARDDRYSQRRSVSFSRSISPRNDREHHSDQKSPRRSRSFRSPPREEKKHRSSYRSLSPSGDGRAFDEGYDEPDRSPSVRAKGQRSLDERSPSLGKKVLSPLRSPSPRGSGRRSHHERYIEPDKSPGSRGKVRSPARPRSRAHRSSSPSGDGRALNEGYDDPDRSPSARGKGRALSRSKKSPSPRGNGERPRDERSPSPRKKVLSPLRSPSPRGNSRRSHHEGYYESDKSPSARSRSRSYSPR